MFATFSRRSVLLVALFAFAGAQSPAEVTGRWVGSVETDRGQMEIGLEVTHAGGKFGGEVTTAHGGWAVTAVSAKDGEWRVTFGTAEEGGTMAGKVADGRFTGAWKTHMAAGTFELVRPRRR